MPRIALLFVLILASQLLGACSRVVSVEPLLGDLPNSEQHWEGAYVGTMNASEKSAYPMLLQLQRRNDGTYVFTIHARGVGHDIFTGAGPLDLVGRGEARLADLGDGYAVAQTRCEIFISTDADLKIERRTLADMMDIAKRQGDLSRKVPHADYLGPYVYGLLRGGPAHPELVLGLDATSIAEHAAQGTKIAVDKWEGGIGDGLLLGAGLVFESDDIHVASNGGPQDARSVRQFFARIAQDVFSKPKVSNSIAWERVTPDRLQSLHFSNHAPADALYGWCNLLALLPKEK